MRDVDLTGEIGDFLRQGNSLAVATRDAALAPNITRACGLHVAARERVVVQLPKSTSAQAMANLAENGTVAIAVSSLRNFRTLQLKGRSVGVTEMSPSDLEVCEAQLRDVAAAALPNGFSRQQVRNLWQFDNWCVEVMVSAVFHQTPGPGAGRVLAGGRSG
jgi:hypothetical protein